MMDDPWRAQHFGSGYSAEFLPLGQRTWRIVKSGGVPIVFPTTRLAREAAKNAYLQRLEPSIRATIERSPEDAQARMEAKLLDEAENWLKSSRENVRAAETVHRPGRRRLIVMAGRAS
ncbi:hypothetical protein [Mesorhizobium amorphae]|uniref:hypothetical protein n=1 Tax=Mesorhizobium amorphae TaxID=71433 RepID=UPI001186ACEA|nr:hypothetical protein [Mesorhizobium amorphae]